MRWRREYLRRMRQRRPWRGSIDGPSQPTKQLGCYRFRDVNGVCSARLALDRKTLIVLAHAGLIAGRIESDAHLKRSVLFFVGEPAVTAGEIFRDSLLVGHADGSLKLYMTMPKATLTTGFVVLPAPIPEVDQSFLLPVQRIDWIDQWSVAVLYRHGSFPTSILALWNLKTHSIVNSVKDNDIRCWSVQNDLLYWCAGLDLCSSQGRLTVFPSSSNCRPSHIFPFGNELLCVAAVGESPELRFFKKGVFLKRVIVSDYSANIVLVSSTTAMILCSDRSGFVYRIRPVVDSDSNDETDLTLCITCLNSTPLSRKIKDLAFDDTIIAVLTEDSLLLYDSLNLQLLQTLTIPGRCRRVNSGCDLNPEDGQLMARILSIDPTGRILIQWGQRTLHLWNVGQALSQLKPLRRASTDKSMRPNRTADLSRDLVEDLDAYADAREEENHMDQMAAAFAVEGLTEAEMLQYAQLLSLEQSNQSDGPSDRGNMEDRDPDLEKALLRSLQEGWL